MLPVRDGAEDRPKSLEAVKEAIWNGGVQPLELLKLNYRAHFGLSAQQMADEPVDEFFTNLVILAEIQRKQKLAADFAEKRMQQNG